MMKLSLLLLVSSATFGNPFVIHPHALIPSTSLFAAKKSNKISGGKGFSKKDTDPLPLSSDRIDPPQNVQQSVSANQPFLQSIDEKGGSNVTPQIEDLPAEERAKSLLKNKYGLKSLEDQQIDAKVQEQRKKLDEWKTKAETDEGFDLIAMLPGPVLIAIDRILKAGVTITGTLFIASGIAITLEAWSKTTGEPLPENVDRFIVRTVEPNFTTGLLVLLGFSISLGLLSAAQLGSQGARYKEVEK